jgi:hypothetical protein
MGTDAGTPFNFHGENAQELERMVAFGMSPMQAILASTSAAARLIGIQDQVGTIERENSRISSYSRTTRFATSTSCATTVELLESCRQGSG